LSTHCFGWNSHWEQVARAYALERGLAEENPVPGRVVTVHRGSLEVETSDGSMAIPGAIAAVGDWVLLDRSNGRLLAVLPRRTQISRKVPGGRTDEQVLAANVDVAILVMGLDGDFNLRRLERFLVAAHESGARALVLLNKADLCGDLEERIGATKTIARSSPVVAASALYDDLAALLAPHIKAGESAALLGSSGAGKSTILNRLLGEERQQTAVVREHDSRGRHTTTARQLILCPQGWLLFDLPGLREVQLWAGRESLEATFEEVVELGRQCRFRDCRHQGEPGCAVAGQVAADRLQSYLRLERELESLEARKGGLAAQNTKRRWKQIHKSMRHHPKNQRFLE
jgi:ribosome biogenesis GTPase